VGGLPPGDGRHLRGCEEMQATASQMPSGTPPDGVGTPRV
jgi:hypothetical protein